MTREATPEAQMCKLILGTIAELPNTARVASALNMAHNMIGQLVDERDRALEAGRLMTERLDAIARLPRTGRWLNWDDVKPYVTPPPAEPLNEQQALIDAIGWSPGDDFDLITTARKLRESAEASDRIRETLLEILEREE